MDIEERWCIKGGDDFKTFIKEWEKKSGLRSRLAGNSGVDWYYPTSDEIFNFMYVDCSRQLPDGIYIPISIEQLKAKSINNTYNIWI